MKNEEGRMKNCGRVEDFRKLNEDPDSEDCWDEEALVCVGLKILERLGIDGGLQGLGAVGE